MIPFDIPWANQTYRRCVNTIPHVSGFFDVLTYYPAFPLDTFTGLGLPPTTDCP